MKTIQHIYTFKEWCEVYYPSVHFTNGLIRDYQIWKDNTLKENEEIRNKRNNANKKNQKYFEGFPIR